MPKLRNIISPLTLILGAPLAAPTSAPTIAYQGRLADAGGNPLTDTYNMIFRLYNVAAGGVPLWEEQWTGSSSVAVSDGLFNVMLGSLTPIPQTVITGNSNLFLGITVGTDNEMSPRVQLGSIPYAIQALTVPDGSISAAKLAPDVSLIPPDGSITTAKLGPGAVTPEKSSGFLIAPDGNLRVQYALRAAVSGTSTTIIFSEPFASPPVVVATADTVSDQNLTVSFINETQFTVSIPNTGGNVSINWIAIGP